MSMHELTAAAPNIEDLPQSLREMAQIIGVTHALTLARHFGGVRLYVPVTMTAEHMIARLIGFEAACRLAREYGGQPDLWIPRAQGWAMRALLGQRNAEIRAKRKRGASLRQLAMEYALTERRIYTIIKARDGEEPPRPPQLDLLTQAR